jgi:hypothetical protein
VVWFEGICEADAKLDEFQEEILPGVYPVPYPKTAITCSPIGNELVVSKVTSSGDANIVGGFFFHRGKEQWKGEGC